jgi:transposase
MEQKEPRGFRIDVSLQLRMFPEPNMLSGRPTSVERERAGFDRRDPRGIFVGPVRLDEHLKRAKLKSPLIVRRVLEKHDWSEFEAAYKCGGRPAYEPMSMVGLILYGNMNAVDSLRGLEELARKDLGCMWVSGGITPDHSVIGRFIIEHGEFLEGAFFEQITRTVLKQTQSGGRRLAGDGTIIQAAAGRYRTLKSEALREFAKKARERATNEGGTRLSQRAALAEHAVGVVDERNQERGKKSRDPTGARVSPIEPDAVVQKQKDRSFAPSYKPSVVANEKRIIVGHAVHGSAEIVAIEAMLEQAERISQQKVETLMLDAGYCTNDVIEQALEREIDLLCPTGSLDKTDGELHRKSSKRFPRSDFSYDAVSDTYRCPAAETLTRVTPRSRAQTLKYGTDKCPGCALRSQCTRDSRGKTLERNH